MIEERLERIENHMVQLIQMVAQSNRITAGLEQSMDRLEQRMDGLEQRMDGLERRMDGLERRFDAESALNTKRHLEIMQQFRHVYADIGYLDEQVHKHDQILKSMGSSQG